MNIVIVGGSTAGVQVARMLRFYDKKSTITIVDSSPHTQYSPCSLPYFIEGKISYKDLFVYEQYDQDTILLHNNTTITKIEPKHVIGVDAQGKEKLFSYDVLVIATGSRPKQIRCQGKAPLFLKTLDDAKKIKDSSGPFVILGAGYIGCELAASLAKKGETVQLVEMQNQVLAQLDADMSQIVFSYLQSLGVEIFLETSLDSFQIDKQTLIQTCGFEPNTQLLEDNNFPIQTNEFLQVKENIYVVGDVAKVKNKQTQKYEHSFFANTAMIQANMVVSNIVGKKQIYPGFLTNAISKIGDLDVGIVGTRTEEACVFAKYKGFDAYVSCGGKELTVKLFVNKDGVIQHAQIIGYKEVSGRLNWIAHCIEHSHTLDDLIRVQTCYNPCVATILDPVIEAAKICRKKLLLLQKR
ncbi:MAG: NAD(P)/FAD-dependent oxidoreductase [Candidatus Woesearchaeota archaeon]